MEETKNNIRVIEMEAVATNYPIVNETKKWVEYGEGNAYPEYLLDLFLESPTNSAIITALSINIDLLFFK